jgi:hypothetical protein
VFKNTYLPVEVSKIEDKISYKPLIVNMRSCNLSDSSERICLHDTNGNRIMDSITDSALLTYENYINNSIGTNLGVPITWSSDGNSVPFFAFSKSADRMEAKMIKRLQDEGGNICGYMTYAYPLGKSNQIPFI